MVSIIIPTANRYDILKKCLEAYLKQTCGYDQYEIIVVDDGSREVKDNTYEIVTEFLNKFSGSIKYLRQEPRGPAAARNLGIKIARGEIVLFTGDDIIPTSNFIKEHINFHNRYPEPNVAMLGLVTKSPDISQSYFMKWLEESGIQFAFSRLTDSQEVSYALFYSSNISLKRDFLLRFGLFDEEFPYAAWEDIELGYRLSKAGLKIIYNQKAVGYHYHLASQKSYNGRSERAGYSSALLHKKHPELRGGPYRGSYLQLEIYLWWLHSVLYTAGILAKPLALLLHNEWLLYKSLHAIALGHFAHGYKRFMSISHRG